LCAVCGVEFGEPSVVAVATTDDHGEMGVVCPECVEYLGKRNPEKFPIIEEYRELLAKYPTAMYPSEEALIAAGEGRDLRTPPRLLTSRRGCGGLRGNTSSPSRSDSTGPGSCGILAFPLPCLVGDLARGGGRGWYAR
jgi:hypothetical protein